MSIAILFDRAKTQKLFIYPENKWKNKQIVVYAKNIILLNNIKNELPTSEPLMNLKINTLHEEDTKGKKD